MSELSPLQLQVVEILLPANFLVNSVLKDVWLENSVFLSRLLENAWDHCRVKVVAYIFAEQWFCCRQVKDWFPAPIMPLPGIQCHVVGKCLNISLRGSGFLIDLCPMVLESSLELREYYARKLRQCGIKLPSLFWRDVALFK